MLTACTVEIEYSKDERTFTHQTSMTNNGSLIENVPCEKAEGLITK